MSICGPPILGPFNSIPPPILGPRTLISGPLIFGPLTSISKPICGGLISSLLLVYTSKLKGGYLLGFFIKTIGSVTAPLKIPLKLFLLKSAFTLGPLIPIPGTERSILGPFKFIPPPILGPFKSIPPPILGPFISPSTSNPILGPFIPIPPSIFGPLNATFGAPILGPFKSIPPPILGPLTSISNPGLGPLISIAERPKSIFGFLISTSILGPPNSGFSTLTLSPKPLLPFPVLVFINILLTFILVKPFGFLFKSIGSSTGAERIPLNKWGL